MSKESFIQKKSIRKTVLIVGALILSVLLGQGIHSAMGTTDIQDRVEKIRDRIFPAMILASDFNSSFLEGTRYLDKAFNIDAELLEEDLLAFDSVTASGGTTLHKMNELAPDQLLNNIDDLYKKWKPAGSQILKNKFVEQEDGDEEEIVEVDVPNVAGITDDIKSYVEARKKEVYTEFQGIITQAVRFLYVTGSIFVILLLIITGFIRFASLIAQSLRNLSEDANAIKDGDLDREVAQTRDDEIGVLQVNFDLMRLEVKDYIDNLDAKVKERTKEVMEEKKKVSDLLNNMRQAVFKINEELEVVGPISGFSTQVFGQEIEGINVFDFLYKDLENGGEEWVALNSGFIAVFGEDDMQWDLSEDNFATKIIRYTDDEKTQKQILSVAYAPLWDEDDELIEIMLVVEDITEVEKLAEEKQAQEESINIIQELSMANLEDIKGYFEGSIKLIKDTQDIHIQGQFDSETVGLMFRYLHTLKGNSRVFGLSMISSVVHRVESQVTEMLQLVKADEKIPIDLTFQIRTGMVDIYQMLSKYSEVAANIFKIDSGFETNIHQDLFQHATQFDRFIVRINTQDRAQQFIQTGLKVFESLKDNAQVLGHTELIMNLQAIEEEVHALEDDSYEVSEVFLSKFNHFRNTIVEIFKDLNNPINHDSTGLTKFALTYYQLSKVSPDEPEAKAALIDTLNSISRIKGFYLLANLCEYLEIADEKEYTSRMKGIQEYLSLAFMLDIKSFSSEAELTHLENQINSSPQELESYLNKSLFKEHFSYKWMRALCRDKEDITKVLGLLIPNGQSLIEFVYSNNQSYHELLDNICSYQFDDSSIDKLISQNVKTDSHINMILSTYLTSAPLLSLIDTRSLVFDYTTIHENQDSMDDNITKVNTNNLDKLTQSIEKIDNEQVKAEIESIIKKLSEVDLKSSFNKYQSMIDELAQSLNKKVDFKITGDSLSLDNEKLSLLHDAMTHMLRNSLDHAIEEEEVRVNQGKEPVGNITLNLKEDNDQIIITLSDDGAGIDGERVYQKALENNVIDPDVKLSENEKQMLIFMPNLSSKEEVSELSGRGVGMDVVKANIEKMNGSINLTSTIGKGTDFTITL